MYPDSVCHDAFYKDRFISKNATPESVLTWGTSSLTGVPSERSLKSSFSTDHLVMPGTPDAPATNISTSPAAVDSPVRSTYPSFGSSSNTIVAANSWSSSPAFAIGSPLVGHCYLHPVLMRGSWHLLYDVITRRFASQPRCDFNESAVQPPVKYLKINLGHALPPIVVYSRSDATGGVTLQDVFQELYNVFKTKVPPNVFSAMSTTTRTIATKQFNKRTNGKGNVYHDGTMWSDFLGPNRYFAGLSQRAKDDTWDAWFVSGPQ
ncbi:hypothetical protein F5146DRAFT_1163509 [Armillaria mellea]|nr:hypothetical protein F5146DRAFT_1163509 [Armillaria mellea]